METNQIQMLGETFGGHALGNHFADIGNMVELRSKA